MSNDAMSEWPTLRRWASEKDKFIMRLYAVLLLSTEMLHDAYTMEDGNWSTIDTDRACAFFMRNARSDVRKALCVFAKQEAVQPQKLLRKCRCAALLAAFLIKMCDPIESGAHTRGNLNVTRSQAWQDFNHNESKRTSPEKEELSNVGNPRIDDDRLGFYSSGAESKRGPTSEEQEDFESADEREFTGGDDGISTADDSEHKREYARRRRRIERETKRDRPASRQDLDDLWAEVERLRALVRNKGAAEEDELKLAAIALPEEKSDSEDEAFEGKGANEGEDNEAEALEHDQEAEAREAPSFGIEEEQHDFGVSSDNVVLGCLEYAIVGYVTTHLTVNIMQSMEKNSDSIGHTSTARIALPVMLSPKLTVAGGGDDVIHRGVHQVAGIAGRPVLTVSRKAGGLAVSLYTADTSETVTAWIQDL